MTIEQLREALSPFRGDQEVMMEDDNEILRPIVYVYSEKNGVVILNTTSLNREHTF